MTENEEEWDKTNPRPASLGVREGQTSIERLQRQCPPAAD